VFDESPHSKLLKKEDTVVSGSLSSECLMKCLHY